MELTKTSYWIPSEEEAEQFETWEAVPHPMDIHPMEFRKKPRPYLIPSENPATIKEQKKYLVISNREDFYVLQMEKQAFDVFFEKHSQELKKYVT